MKAPVLFISDFQVTATDDDDEGAAVVAAAISVQFCGKFKKTRRYQATILIKYFSVYACKFSPRLLVCYFTLESAASVSTITRRRWCLFFLSFFLFSMGQREKKGFCVLCEIALHPKNRASAASAAARHQRGHLYLNKRIGDDDADAGSSTRWGGVGNVAPRLDAYSARPALLLFLLLACFQQYNPLVVFVFASRPWTFIVPYRPARYTAAPIATHEPLDSL